MPDERSSPSGGWREVYRAMGTGGGLADDSEADDDPASTDPAPSNAPGRRERERPTASRLTNR